LSCVFTAFGFSQRSDAAQKKAASSAAAEKPLDPALAGLAEALPMLDDKMRRGLALQVALDRAGFSPGEIDAAPGTNTDRAMAAFKAAKGTTALGDVYGNPVATYMIGAEDVAGPLVERIPEDMMEKSKLSSLGYTSVLELLGERFHSSPKLLQRLNPNAQFIQGEVIVVPNVETLIAPGLKSPVQQTDAAPAGGFAPPPNTSPASTTRASDSARTRAGATARSSATVPKAPGGPFTIIVTDRTKTLQVENAAGEVVMHAPVTVGSENDPLPIGEWKVNGVSRNPVFNYNPKLFWDADAKDAKARIAAGPNNPVGVVWIDLSKNHYGIHGTPEPSRIGYTESHGCIRLTNWDVMRLADLVSPGTKVILR
jgi:lipoprotein-anchoring transpeptidase ErfK/SrfK